MNTYEQHSLPLREALKNEFTHGMQSMGSPEVVEGFPSSLEVLGDTVLFPLQSFEVCNI